MRLSPLFASLSLLLASAPLYAASLQKTVEFKPLDLPTSDADKHVVRTTDEVTVNGGKQAIAFQEYMRTGAQDNDEVFGLMKDVKGNPISVDGTPYVCNGVNGTSGSGMDFSSILHDNGKLYVMSQFECNVGGMYMSEVQQDKDGKLSPVKDTLQFIDQSGDFGGFVHCAGMVTPWGSHLGGEEYEPDAANIEEQIGNPDGITDKKYVAYPKYYWQDDLKNPAKSSPYMVGWVTETRIRDGKGHYSKHYAMGRFSHELAYVLPDQKTAYLTDDGDNGTLFMFVADQAGNLSAGTLYAAKWNQTDGNNGGTAKLEWVSLGHASDADLKAAIARLPKFSELFETGDTDKCDTQNGFVLVSPAGFKKQCLKVRDGKEVLASRLEARRYAAIKGATHEFRKMEGFTYDADRNTGYLAISEAARGMLDNTDDVEEQKNYDSATGNHIRLAQPNYCGGVYALSMQDGVKDTDGKAIGSSHVATGIKAVVMGGSATDASLNAGGAESCAANTLDWFAQPDNLSFLPHSDTLLIGEDGEHENNMLWAYDIGNNSLTRVATVPVGAETTSPYWHLDVNGDGYIGMVAQHAKSMDDPQSVLGFIGPIKGLVK
ncbi:alkaline phosphatase PhoX [Thiothrix nivea]|uniref:Alkaline phosphatase n=1 Tax=Thiothrix nivea (strain ATCC 35100 / DSM 5205 / JP2) TaxID=870187 RepID=A0A656HER1_THINJ|nr:alkaline phosphatase PhoX [Thiothrix nivea]EIJ33679.1 protein of unknown function DUF839 [Thiothrix nivea DSM 5205]